MVENEMRYRTEAHDFYFLCRNIIQLVQLGNLDCTAAVQCCVIIVGKMIVL